jgi:putative tryptophan/tyrosine transport system substrate-binding protein
MAQSVEGVTGKLVEVALEIIPGARRIGFLSNPRGASMPLFAESVNVAARARGLAVLTEEVATGGELASAFDRFGKQGAQAVIVPVNGLFFSEGRQIAQLALAARLPTVGAERRYIEAGVLASYGIDQRESYRRGASYVDRILKGAKPGDLPIEFPSRIELAIGLDSRWRSNLCILCEFANFEPLHFRIGIRRDSQPRWRNSNLRIWESDPLLSLSRKARN